MIMNKIDKSTYTVLAFITISLAACTKNNDVVPDTMGPEICAAFSVDDAQTRVNTLEEGNSWDNGDKIAVRVAKDDEMRAAVLTYSYSDGMGVWSRDKAFCWSDENSYHTIWASYPSEYDAFSFELPSGQETVEKLKKADYINGTWQGKPTYVNVSMRHRMALVTVTYVLGSSDFEDNTLPTKAEVLSKNSLATFDTEGTMMGLSGGEKWVTACLREGNKFSAIVTPGTYKRDEEFLKLTVNGKEYKVAMRMEEEFEEGHEYPYTLNIGKNKAWMTKLSSDNPSGWTKEENLQQQTGTIGTPDEGKTSWKDGDELLAKVYDKHHGDTFASFTYNGGAWNLTGGGLYYREDNVPYGYVYYAPDYMWGSSGTPELKDGKVAGTGEYIQVNAYPTGDGAGLDVDFSSAGRNYSRLRMATEPNKEVSVIVSKFIPVNGNAMGDTSYSLTSDDNGNVFLYGSFVAGSSVAVKSEEEFLARYTFTAATVSGKSYALDATGRK